ncbi:MAG: PorV/PorQ family protein [Dehalococcoidales bacterium]|nr:PorV/PorQ family protein [Dehalococcoidales bacterium]
MVKNTPKILNKSILIAAMTVILVLVAICAFAWGTKDVGTASLEFLRIGVGARPAACGESFVAVANDATAIFWNPAGLAQLNNQEVSVMHLEWFGGFKYDSLSYVYPTAKGNFGAGFVYLHNNDIDKTSAAPGGRYNRDGFFTFSDSALVASYSNKLNESLLYGINAKFIQEAIDGSQDYSLVTDLGLIYYDSKHKIKLGSSIQNIGLKTNGAFPPIVIRLGIACNPFSKDLTLASDIDLPKAGRPSLNLGAEYWFKGILAIRAGYKYKNGNAEMDNIVGLTAGMGLRIRNYMLDYAFVPYGELGNTHRLSLSLQWGNKTMEETR